MSCVCFFSNNRVHISKFLTQTAPFYDDVVDDPGNVQTFWVKTQDDVRLRLALWEGGNLGTIQFFVGRSEFIEKYAHLARRINNIGFSVVIHDWRGHGLSDRMHSIPNICHVERFQDYQLDLKAVWKFLKNFGVSLPYFIITHSMGGCIALRTLQTKIPFPLGAIVFLAPMWKINRSNFIVSNIAGLMKYTNFRNKFVFGAGPNNFLLTSNPNSNSLTSNSKTFLYLRNQVQTYPALGLGGPSWNWVHQALLESGKLMNMPPPEFNSLVFVAGKESIVDNQAIYNFCKNWKQSQIVFVNDSKHELLKERPQIVDMVLEKTFHFFCQQN